MSIITFYANTFFEISAIKTKGAALSIFKALITSDFNKII